MRIAFRNLERRMIGRMEIDPDARPTRVRPPGAERDVFLEWEGAVDDAGRLRKCVVCGCGDLFREKVFPQVTGLVVVLAFTGATVGVFGSVLSRQQTITTPLLAVMVAVLLADVGILLFARSRLVCYRCRTSYHDVPIARYHRSWDRGVADRYAPPHSARGRNGDEPAEAAEPPPIAASGQAPPARAGEA